MTIRFYLETYGCSLNAADSDLMVGRLHQMNAHSVDTPENADVIIVNTCGVKEPTEDRIIHRLTTLSQCGPPVIVTGCLPKISLNRVKSAVPNFGAIMGPQSITTLGSIVKKVYQGERGIIHFKTDSISKLRYFEGPPDSVICTIPICEGCLGNCAYCAVRFARNTVKSYSIKEIFATVRRAIHTGYREIRLTAQDVGAFGRDSGESLVDLLKTLDTIEGNHRFRVGMFNPDLVSGILDDILEIMQSDHFFKFFHVPLQSGSDNVLRAMNRKYTVAEWKSVVNRIRRSFPYASIATDVIVGFPGETSEDFNASISVIRAIRPQIVNISKYGDRPGTKAARSNKKVNTMIKKARSRQMSLLVHKLVTNDHRAWIGWAGPVMVTDRASRGGFLGRNASYLPVILPDNNIEIGSDVFVRIVDAKRTHLIARIQSRD